MCYQPPAKINDAKNNLNSTQKTDFQLPLYIKGLKDLPGVDRCIATVKSNILEKNRACVALCVCMLATTTISYFISVFFISF